MNPQLEIDLWKAQQGDSLIRLMLNPNIPRNQSKCRECKLYQPDNDHHGSCANKQVVIANELSCYRFQP